MESDELVVAAEFYSGAQAKTAHALLKSAGIPSFLKGTITAIQLMLPRSFLEQAHELLDSQISEEDRSRRPRPLQPKIRTMTH
jgi:hypothetical protein